MNYYLSVIPFLAAVQKGVIGDGQLQVQIQTPSDAVQDYCTSYTDCSTKFPDLMAKWEAFYQVTSHDHDFNPDFNPDPLIQTTS